MNPNAIFTLLMWTWVNACVQFKHTSYWRFLQCVHFTMNQFDVFMFIFPQVSSRGVQAPGALTPLPARTGSSSACEWTDNAHTLSLFTHHSHASITDAHWLLFVPVSVSLGLSFTMITLIFHTQYVDAQEILRTLYYFLQMFKVIKICWVYHSIGF